MSAPRDEALDALAGFWDRTPWEPWTPQEGDRVRLSPQTECDAYESTLPFDGFTGTVEHVNDIGEVEDGHRFWVRMDDPVAREHFWHGTARMSAAELLPLDATEQAGSARP